MKMSCSNYSSVSSNSNFKQRKLFRSDHRPRMLKDFLTDDSYSNGFKSCDSTVGDLIQNDLVIRCRSRAASTTVAAIYAMINAVKNIHFTTVNTPSILPRSISRRLSKKTSTCTHSEVVKNIHFTTVNTPSILPRSISRRLSKKTSTCTHSENSDTETKLTVTIKDIIRWKSFRDLSEDKSPPLDLASSPHHCTTSTATTGSTATTPCSSNGSSWCESDFTAEYLPSWKGNSEEDEAGKNYLPRVGEEAATKTYSAVGPNEEQKQQHSPISVIDIKYEEEEIVGEVEEKAWQLWDHVKETSSVFDCEMVLDFFRDEISKSGYTIRNEELENEMISRVKAWMGGENRLWIGWDKREAYVREMDKDGKWSNFDEEQQHMAVQIEDGLVGLLVDDLLLDLIYSQYQLVHSARNNYGKIRK